MILIRVSASDGFSCGYSYCETIVGVSDCCIVLSDYLIYAVSEVYADYD